MDFILDLGAVTKTTAGSYVPMMLEYVDPPFQWRDDEGPADPP